MKKHTPDSTEFAATFTIPDNVREQVAEIVGKAHQSYPDHGESRVVMIQQELINALSKATLERDLVMQVTDEAAQRALEIHQRLMFPLT